MVDETQVEEEVGEFSLADIAQLDASEIAEVRFESLPAGVYVFRGESAQFEDGTNRDDERRVILVVKMEVIEVKSVIDRDYKTDEQKESLLGKKHTEKMYVVPEKAAEGLGLIRAFIGDIGLPNEGPFGGVEGSDPGIVDGFVGHEFTGKIVQRPRKGDPTIKDSSLRIDKPKGK
jgi:hypothetical protein